MTEWTKIIMASLMPAIFWSSSDIMSRIASDKVSPFLGAAFISLGMFISTGFIFLLTNEPIKELTSTNPKFALLTVASGIINGIGFYFFFKFLANGGNFTQGMPLLLLFIVLITSISGILFFGDTFSTKTFIGFILGAAAIYLLS